MKDIAIKDFKITSKIKIKDLPTTFDLEINKKENRTRIENG